MNEKLRAPANVLVQGQQCPVSVKKGKIKTEIKDPLAPVKNSPYAELLPASEEWVKKYGGSDNSIVAYNIHKLRLLWQLKEKASGKNKKPDKEQDEGTDQEPETDQG